MHHENTVPPPHPAHKTLRILLYVVLLISACVSFFFNAQLWEAARQDNLPVWAPVAAPATFTLFVLVYTFDRWFLVKKQHYPVFRAFSQIVLAVLFLLFLLPEQKAEFQHTREVRTPTESARTLFFYNDPHIRAAACNILKHHTHPNIRSMVDKLASEDPSEEVQKACSR